MHTCKRPMISLFVIWMREVSSTAKAGKLITLSRDELHSWKKKQSETNLLFLEPFKRQPHKMVKHTKTIRRLLPTNCECI